MTKYNVFYNEDHHHGALVEAETAEEAKQLALEQWQAEDGEGADLHPVGAVRVVEETVSE